MLEGLPPPAPLTIQISPRRVPRASFPPGIKSIDPTSSAVSLGVSKEVIL